MDPDPSNDPSNEGLDIGINRAVSDVDLISAVARNSDRLQQSKLIQQDSTDGRFCLTTIRSVTVN